MNVMASAQTLRQRNVRREREKRTDMTSYDNICRPHTPRNGPFYGRKQIDNTSHLRYEWELD